MAAFRKLVPTCNDRVGDSSRTSCPLCDEGLVLPPDEGPERMLKAKSLGSAVYTYVLSVPPYSLYIDLGSKRLTCVDYIDGPCSLVSGWLGPW